MSFFATYLGSSGWLLDVSGIKILIDPWLKGDLFFKPGPWLINGRLKCDLHVPDNINLLLLTQGLPDHSHPTSLKLLNRSIPVFASTSAAKVVMKLGFQNIIPLKPGDKSNYREITIEATEGARVPTLENGYIISNKSYSFYIEPHGFLDKNIKAKHLDVVISPVVNLSLPFAGSFIRGKSALPELLQKFHPNILFSSTTGGDAKFTGILNKLISVQGSEEEALAFLYGKTTFINPIPLMKYTLPVVN